MKILITGGAGFIGSHVVRLFVTKYPNYQILNLDALTYAGNLENLRDIENASNYRFIKGDIADQAFVDELFAKEEPDAVIHLAAGKPRRPLHHRPAGLRAYQRARHRASAERGQEPVETYWLRRPHVLPHVQHR